MITAHIPSGYVLARTAGWRRSVMAVAVFGATFPDLDLIWFYLIDDRAIHHHMYWVHAPAFALTMSLLLVAAVGRLAPRFARHAVAFGFGWGLHILLDAPMGQIMWLWPISDVLYSPITVPARHDFWVWNFLLHWSFALELAVWLTAAVLMLRRPRHAR
ncbi:MAG: metal-dependent hydrolase [Silicimonas sp.]|nr:metal-dependent hydrolase [Silicimonas sp.]